MRYSLSAALLALPALAFAEDGGTSETPRVTTTATPVIGGAAVKTVGVKLPVIVRLEGTNADVARKRLKDSGLAIVAASDLTDAATKAVSLAR